LKLQPFLDAKPLYYDTIDYERMPRAYRSIASHLSLPPVLHIVGTNGKGTTGRFLANALWRKGFHTGHYTSPHIERFNERIWLDGNPVDDELLERAHTRLLGLLGQACADALSYFEYTTLLAAVVYEACDYVVMEAGLGGEHDATNVFPKSLSIFTPIGLDHQAFLGDTLESIASTKFRSMQTRSLIARQPYDEVYEVFGRIGEERGSECLRVGELIQPSELKIVETVAARLELPGYLRENLTTAVAALKLLEIAPEASLFNDGTLFGRLSKIAPNIWLDVGHNVLAAEAIASALVGKQVILVYNTYKDKSYSDILKVLKPVIRRVELITIDDVRAEEPTKVEAVLQLNNIEYGNFERIDPSAEYLVFGSFSVAEAFLKVYHE
jgi:dihydrofolate synthase/folylpolyglutamate synthase